MKRGGFLLMYLLLLAVQILAGNYCNFTQHFTLTILPVMVLCIPIRYGTIFAMCAAFATGFCCGFLGDGFLGLAILALVPVGLGRKALIQLVFGSEVFSRGEDISFRRQGVPKMALATLIATAVYMAIYVWADGAGTLSFRFCLTKFLLSTLGSTAVSLFAAHLLTSDDLGKWK